MFFIATAAAAKVKTIVDDISEKMPDQFNMHDIMAKCEERTPYIIVCFQVEQIIVVVSRANVFCDECQNCSAQ